MSTVAPSGSTTPPTLRLPNDAHPTRYDLDLWLDPEAKTFRGQIRADLNVQTSTTVLWLNSTALGIDSASLTVPGSAPRIARIVPGGDDFVGFAFDAPIPVGAARLTVLFHGAPDSERSQGIYQVKEAGGESYLYTFFEPIDSRRAFPSFDEPGDKVPWKITLHVPNGDVALGNAKVVSETKEDAHTKAVAFEETKPLPSYLVAFVVGPFEVVDAPPAGRHATPLRFVIPKGRKAELAYAAEVTPKIVGLLEDYFGIPYPYGKLDVAVVPRFWGTMEHPGLVALGQPLTLITPADRGLRRERRYANIATHELGHYWFGDYVTTAWWDDTWLNEALTTWIDSKITQEVNPAWRFDLDRVTRMNDAMEADALASAKKIRQPVVTKSDIQSSFDNDITYFKGQAVFGMVEGWLGEAKQQKAVQAYLATHAWKNATSEDLFASFENVQKGAGDTLRSFVDQPGIPLVTVTPTCENGSAGFKLEQRRYRLSGETSPDETWRIPVCYRYGNKPFDKPKSDGMEGHACMILDAPTKVVTDEGNACSTWVEPNTDGLGYYHSTYTSEAMATAFRYANDGEKIALLRDAVALVASGDGKLGDLLARIKDTSTSEIAPIVEAGWNVERYAVDQMDRSQEAKLEHFLARTYGPISRKLGLRKQPGDSAATVLIRSYAFALAAREGNDAALRKLAHDAAMKWLTDPGAIDADMRAHVLIAAARTNDPKLFAALLTKAKGAASKTELDEILFVLGTFSAPALVAQLEQLIDTQAFDPRELTILLGMQLSELATREEAWRYLNAHFEAIASRMRNDEVGSYVIDQLRFCDETHRREIEALGPRVAKIDGAPHALAKATDRIAQCARSAAANRSSVDAFLAKY